MITQKVHKWFIFTIFLVMLLSGCGNGGNVLTATPTTTSSSGTASPSTSDGGIVNVPLATTGCGKAPPIAPGTSADATLTSGGRQRTYRLHVPAGYDPRQMTPMVLSFHGHGGTALQQERFSQYSPLADQQHFLVVYPQGVIGPDGKTGWSTARKHEPAVNDVLFISDLLTTLQQHLCVDPHRIYVSGISNGGGMTNLLACRLAGRIAAFAPVAAAIYPIFGGCHPSRPVPYLEFHGTGDPVVPYNGGTARQFSPVMQTMQGWATLDGCTSGPTIFFQHADVTGFQWTGCKDGVMVQHYRIYGGGHTWPGALVSTGNGFTTHTISATTLSWQFFQKYQLP
jgi:polyhydroxybutyrate depolymerase